MRVHDREKKVVRSNAGEAINCAKSKVPEERELFQGWNARKRCPVSISFGDSTNA
jgi:hypothetical protein